MVNGFFNVIGTQILNSSSSSFFSNITDEKLFLGELQFAFICFLIGESLEALEQWKKMVTLVCSCEDALLTHPKFFSEAIGKSYPHPVCLTPTCSSLTHYHTCSCFASSASRGSKGFLYR